MERKGLFAPDHHKKSSGADMYCNMPKTVDVRISCCLDVRGKSIKWIRNTKTHSILCIREELHISFTSL
ncbi:hypothetical protein SAMN04487897_12626 [Paenibacillus sp. yr247]|nr:hypothetical protein SAMN04487897_12626 [Paenibacillus sp. yr247]